MTESKIQPLTEEERRRFEAQNTIRQRALEAGIDDGYVLGFLTSAIGECADILDENRSQTEQMILALDHQRAKFKRPRISKLIRKKREQQKKNVQAIVHEINHALQIPETIMFSYLEQSYEDKREQYKPEIQSKIEQALTVLFPFRHEIIPAPEHPIVLFRAK